MKYNLHTVVENHLQHDISVTLNILNLRDASRTMSFFSRNYEIIKLKFCQIKQVLFDFAHEKLIVR